MQTGDRITTPTQRRGTIQEPAHWNSIALPGHSLVLLDGLDHPQWFRTELLSPLPETGQAAPSSTAQNRAISTKTKEKKP